MNTKVLYSQDVETLKSLLQSSWKNHSAEQLAKLEVPVSLFNLLVKSWENLLKHENDIKLAITLKDVHFSNIAFKAFAAALSENNTIEFLSLRNISDTEALVLAETITKNETIAQINLSDNFIGDEGATALAEALKQNNTVEWLDLSNNTIEDFGAQALASMLKKNDTVKYINLKNNPIKTEGKHWLSNVALSCLTSCCIWVTENNKDLRLPFAY